MAKVKEDISIKILKDTLKYAEKCNEIQNQILDYCLYITNRKEAIDKMEIVEDLRAIAMWDEEDNCSVTNQKLAVYEEIVNSGNCNVCGKRSTCKYRPKLGELIRYNCPLYKRKKEE